MQACHPSLTETPASAHLRSQACLALITNEGLRSLLLTGGRAQVQRVQQILKLLRVGVVLPCHQSVGG